MKLVVLLLAGVASLSLCRSVPAQEAPRPSMTITVAENAIHIQEGRRTVLRYAYNDVPFKPYAQQCFTPGGVQVLRDAPHDHLHHHALMYALGVNGISFWEETDKGGKQIHRGFSDVSVNAGQDFDWAGFSQALDWIPPKQDNPLIQEQRTVGVLQSKALDALLITWETRLVCAPGVDSVELTGSHYYGLGMRFVESMDQGGRFLYAAGQPGDIVRGDERNTPDTWCAYQAQADGKPVTIAMFGDPENARGPATWFTMGDASPHFAYLAATLNLDDEPMPLKAGESLHLRYAVVCYDGHRNVEHMDALYRWWKDHMLHTLH